MVSADSTPSGARNDSPTIELDAADATSEVQPATVNDAQPETHSSRLGRAKRVSGDRGGDGDPDSTDRARTRVPLFAPARRPGRRVIRIVRHVQLWSVFKVAILGGLVLYAIFLLSVGVVWSLANSTGQVHHIEQFMRDVGFDNWSFNGAELFKAAALAGALLLGATSILLTLWAAVINLIAEATGGLRFTVIETDEVDDDFDDDDER